MRREPRPATVPPRTAQPPGSTCSLSSAYSSPPSSSSRHKNTERTLYQTTPQNYTKRGRAHNSDVLERERFGESRVAERYERLPSQQPARRCHEAPADSEECGHVQNRRTDSFGMERR